MDRTITSPRRLAAAVAAVVIAACAGIAYAAIPDATGVIHACHSKLGVLRAIDTEAGQTCTAAETPLDWNRAGPAGPAGAPGPHGPAGPQGAPGAVGYEMSERLGQDLPMSGEQTLGRVIDLPAGSYLVSATVDAMASNAQIVCAIFADGRVVQNGHLANPDSGMGTIAMSGAYTGDAAELRVDCAASPGGSDEPYATQASVQWLTLTAVQVGTLHQS